MLWRAKVEGLFTPLLQEAARAIRAVREVHGATPAPVAGSTLLGGLLRLVPGAAGEAGVDAAAIIYATGHPDIYRFLVIEGPWTADQWATWVRSTLQAGLLAP